MLLRNTINFWYFRKELETIDIAILFQKKSHIVSNLCYGLLGGISLMQLVLVSYTKYLLQIFNIFPDCLDLVKIAQCWNFQTFEMITVHFQPHTLLLIWLFRVFQTYTLTKGSKHEIIKFIELYSKFGYVPSASFSILTTICLVFAFDRYVLNNYELLHLNWVRFFWNVLSQWAHIQPRNCIRIQEEQIKWLEWQIAAVY